MARPPKKDASLPPFVPFDKALFDAFLLADFAGVAEVKVALAMIRYTIGHRGHGAGNTMSTRFLAAKTNLNKATVQRATRGLVRAGFARVVGDARGRRATAYAVVTDPGAWHFDGPLTRRRAPMKAAAKGLSAELAAALRTHGGVHTVRMVAYTNSALCTHGGVHPCTEERTEDVLLKTEDDAASAKAAPSSSPEPPPDVALSDVQRKALASLARFCDPKETP